MTRKTARSVLGMAAVALWVGASGCVASKKVEGKVVEGPASIMVQADAKDSRIKGPGVSAARVELRARGPGGEDRIVSEVEVKPDGSFELPFEGFTLYDQGTLVVTRPGYSPARGKFVVPDEGRRILVIMRKSGSEQSTEHAAVPETPGR